MDHVSRVSIFIEVVKHASFAGAARALGMTGPAISKQVQSLEKQLGVMLLTRTTRHVSLTEEGAIYFDRARKALEDLNEAEQHIQELKAVPTGKLKVNAPMSFGAQYLAQPIAKFAYNYPDVELEVDFNDRWVDIIGEGYDVVIRIGALEDSNLIARKLAPCPVKLYATPALIESYGPITKHNVSEIPSIVYNRHTQKNEWRFVDQNGVVDSIELNRVMAANTAEMELHACLQNVGITVLPIFIAYPYLESGQLVDLFPEFQMYPERSIYAMFPQNRYLSTRTRLFVDWLSNEASQFPWVI